MAEHKPSMSMPWFDPQRHRNATALGLHFKYGNMRSGKTFLHYFIKKSFFLVNERERVSASAKHHRKKKVLVA